MILSLTLPYPALSTALIMTRLILIPMIVELLQRGPRNSMAQTDAFDASVREMDLPNHVSTASKLKGNL